MERSVTVLHEVKHLDRTMRELQGRACGIFDCTKCSGNGNVMKVYTSEMERAPDF